MDFGEAEGGTISKELAVYHFLFGLIQFIAALVQLIIFSCLYTGLREPTFQAVHRPGLIYSCDSVGVPRFHRIHTFSTNPPSK